MTAEPNPSEPEMNESAADVESPAEDAGESRPLERMEIEPSANGGAIVTHHPKLPERVRGMDIAGAKPKKHAFETKDKALEHIKKNLSRLKD